ncbi:MAG TPA: TIGR02281 family clan AA aspartic protease, partial [Caulobacteraceae bacterium]|nr:TIGR02281 family clan AA aspartic protease [Caulobacteraceae bacterium]
MTIGVIAALFAMGGARLLTAFTPSHPAPTPAMAVATLPASDAASQASSAGEASIAKSLDGHFWAQAEVDGHPVRFLVDTGATAVALTADDARNLGIDTSALPYQYTVMTANGPAKAAQVKLGFVAVGRAQVSDVQAFVIDKGLETSLLGMSYLGRLSKFEATPDALVLKS